MEFEVLSPWAETDPVAPKGLEPRLDDLNGKTIGLLCYFKYAGPPIVAEMERLLKEKFPSTNISHWRYYKHPCEVIKDPEYKEPFQDWVKGVDAVITFHGD